MFNGPVPTNIKSGAAQGIINECLPGLQVYRDRFGRAAVSIPDSETDEATQSAGTIDESVLLEPPDIDYPGGKQRLTSLSTKFLDASRSFDSEEAIYPVPGSPFALELLKTVNGEPNLQRLDIEGAIDPDQAHTTAQTCLLYTSDAAGRG